MVAVKPDATPNARSHEENLSKTIKPYIETA